MQIMLEIVAPIGFASQPLERRMTGTPTDWNANRSCQ